MVPPAHEGDLPAAAPVLTLTLGDLAELARKLADSAIDTGADGFTSHGFAEAVGNLRTLAILLDMAQGQQAEALRALDPLRAIDGLLDRVQDGRAAPVAEARA